MRGRLARVLAASTLARHTHARPALLLGAGGLGFVSATSISGALRMSAGQDEVAAARAVAASFQDDEPATIFDKIISKEIPADVVWEDEQALAFRDISPQAPTHVLVIPKVRAGLTRLTKATLEHKAQLGHLLWAASEVAKQEGLAEGGCRFVVNDGADGAQSVLHLHIHILGGRQMTWPPG